MDHGLAVMSGELQKAKTPEEQRMFRLLQLRYGLNLELRGDAMSTGGAVYTMVRKEFKLHGSPAKVLSLFEDYIKSQLH